MSLPTKVTIEHLRAKSSALSCDDQFELATKIANNIGYVLIPEPQIDLITKRLTPDQIVERFNALAGQNLELVSRLARLERLVDQGK